MADEKKLIRKNVLAARDAITKNMRFEKSSQIIKRLLLTEEYKRADVLLTYVNYRSEVITTSFIEHLLAQKKSVFAPRVEKNDMDFYRIYTMEELTAGYRGILEPAGNELFKADGAYALMIMPGAAFDKKRHRIGYGKGFYDRYLTRMEEMGIVMHTLALCFECQMLCEIPYEIHDKKPDLIITEKRIIDGKENVGKESYHE